MSNPANGGEGGPTGGSLLSTVRGLATTLLATARTRVELVGNELETERLRLVHLLVLGISALFCLGLAVLLLVGLALVLYWDSRVAVLAGFGTTFLVAGIGLFMGMKRANGRRQAFAATISELEEDLRQLRAATGHGKTD